MDLNKQRKLETLLGISLELTSNIVIVNFPSLDRIQYHQLVMLALDLEVNGKSIPFLTSHPSNIGANFEPPKHQLECGFERF